MSVVSSTGPMPADKFRELIDAPYGAAAVAIRQYDPMWGRKDGEKIKWRVTARAKVEMRAIVTVEASSREEAEKLADALPDSSFDWEPDDFADYDWTSLEAEPAA